MTESTTHLLRALASLVFLASVQSAGAYEERFYSSAEPNDLSLRRTIFGTVRTADRMLECRSIDEIDIGITKITKDNQATSDPEYFTRSQLRQFLMAEKHKDLLVARLQKMPPEGYEETKRRLKQFVQELGYKRVLILGAHAFGVSVLYDSAEKMARGDCEWIGVAAYCNDDIYNSDRISNFHIACTLCGPSNGVGLLPIRKNEIPGNEFQGAVKIGTKWIIALPHAVPRAGCFRPLESQGLVEYNHKNLDAVLDEIQGVHPEEFLSNTQRDKLKALIDDWRDPGGDQGPKLRTLRDEHSESGK